MNHIDGGPGWIIDGKTLLPRIVDPEEFRRSLADDPLREGIEALWSGRPDEAAELIEGHEPTFRTRALKADCLRDQGELDLAIAEYRELIDECAGTAWEAVMRQHLGKALFSASRFTEAGEQFAEALRLREDTGADQDLLTSSHYALRVAELAMA